jgi:hypothetical protein
VGGRPPTVELEVAAASGGGHGHPQPPPMYSGETGGGLCHPHLLRGWLHHPRNVSVVPPRHSRGGATTPGPPQWLVNHPLGWSANHVGV